MICEEIIEMLRRQSPEAYACDWDNVGLLVGSRKKEVHTVYLALDATDEAIREAAKAGADLLLTHHPMIFKGLKKITDDDFIGRRVIELIKHDIAYYAMHTNFDVSDMARLAAERLKLKETSVLQPMPGLGAEGSLGIGCIGCLPKAMTLSACAEWTKRAFGLESVRVFGDMNREVLRAAVCPGSGKSVIADGIRSGAQVLITGDIDHHEGIDASAQGMSVIDAGHYGLEQIFIPYLKRRLEEEMPQLEVLEKPPGQPFILI